MDQVEEVKQKTDIVSLINEYIPLKKAGRHFKANCPFHQERTPSFMVSPELQIYKCFGCGEAGDVFSFLEKYEGMDFYEALKFLAGRAGVSLKSLPGRGGDKEKLYKINELSFKFYQYILHNHPSGRRALEYLTADRGLKLETIKTFQIGFAPNVQGALSGFLLNKKKYTPGDLLQAGVAVNTPRGLIDRFRGRVIFPLFDHRGNPIGLAGRILPQYETRDVGKYINSPETLVYHKGAVLYGLNLTKSEIKKEGQAIVVEGEIDLISSWQAGIKNAVAIKGTALTPDQVKILSRITNVLDLFLDSDIAGDAAARRGISIAQEAGVEVRVVRAERYKDPDEFARADPEGFKKAVGGAVNVWDFFIESVFSRFDGSTGEGKAKISRELVPILAGIGNKIVQAHYVGILAKRLGVSVEAVSSEIEKAGPDRERKEERVQKPIERKSRRELLEERLISLGLLFEREIFKDREILELILSPWSKRVLSFFAKIKMKEFDLGKFVRSLPKELATRLSEALLLESKEREEESEARKEIGIIIRELKVLWARERLSEVAKRISEAEREKRTDNLEELNQEFSRISSELAKLQG